MELYNYIECCCIVLGIIILAACMHNHINLIVNIKAVDLRFITFHQGQSIAEVGTWMLKLHQIIDMHCAHLIQK